MTTNAVPSTGTLLKVGDGATPEVFTTVAEVKDIKGPSFEQDTIDVTTHESSGRFKEYIPGLMDAGELTAELNFIPTETTHGLTTGLMQDMFDGTRRNFQLVFPDAGATTWNFAAFVKKFEIEEGVGDVLGAKVSLQITGQPTFS